MLMQMQDVRLIRDGKTILDDINWEVNNGEHWAIIGMNGAGKTALLNLVCGYLYPTKGTISVFGKQFGHYPLNELRKQIGWVSLSFSEKMQHHADNSGIQIILSGKFASIGLYEQPSWNDIEKASEILEQLGIERLREQSYRSMSQGEKQRILIGRALMASPKLLILDEPCTGLDFLSKELLLSTINQMADKQQTTILYVTHQLDEILPIFTHSLLLREGRIFSQGLTKNQLTSENVSNFCNTPVQISQENNRYLLELGLKTGV
ncbi:molybdenum ABC transporter ATP-binding protein [Virgibacillus phasianinus]|uniref:Molybdenum ABC transporter ATP-binding protein n=1 Tax=Virgibacillus phasianinus TaxID=2017483 RepID=A0A220U0F4_9BACI|nr:ABC transporter ATP-binding protein [Virgibacillus phasianinus]ASK61558.1 molybdenum ABC transporter ATP-binding protein [Virgibacillus phasianinus]